MTSDAPSASSREGQAFAQLLRQQERALRLLKELKEELEAPVTRRILEGIQERGTDRLEDAYARMSQRIEEGLDAVKHCRSELEHEMAKYHEELPLEGPDDLPPALARFLASRSENPGFEYRVRQDETRGWVVWWKEYTEWGTVRGSGQIYERPYAWLND